ncbi:zinc ribbon protein [Paenibacillus sp. BK033]|nr:zinc ribbon protein [Paenibacillus sp. BK033]
MKVCQTCGHKNVDTHNFCENCAAPLGVAGETPAPTPKWLTAQAQEETLARLKKKEKEKRPVYCDFYCSSIYDSNRYYWSQQFAIY